VFLVRSPVAYHSAGTRWGTATFKFYEGRDILSPAGFEHFALELGEPAHEDTPPPTLAVPAPEVLGPVAERYGIEVVGPPHRAR
jgi:hypothetical protein